MKKQFNKWKEGMEERGVESNMEKAKYYVVTVNEARKD